TNELVFTKEELLVNTDVYQVEDGTLFYHDYSQIPQRLYVKWLETEVQAEYLELYVHGPHGNSLYFESDGKIYSACFPEDTGLIITFVRDRLEDERIHHGTLCSRARAGVNYVYHLGDDPYIDGVPVDIPMDLHNGLELKGLHRNKIYFVGQSMDDCPLWNELTDDAIALELPTEPFQTHVFAQESSSLLHIINSTAGLLFTVNTGTGKFLPTLKFRKFCN
ncbi:hypothetical protein PENTCL1PPCAC_8386, partial [Pristionchus entomophagus]